MVSLTGVAEIMLLSTVLARSKSDGLVAFATVNIRVGDVVLESNRIVLATATDAGSIIYIGFKSDDVSSAFGQNFDVCGGFAKGDGVFASQTVDHNFLVLLPILIESLGIVSLRAVPRTVSYVATEERRGLPPKGIGSSHCMSICVPLP